MSGQYIVNENGKRVRVVPDIEEYARMVEEFEGILDQQVYDRAKVELEHRDDEQRIATILQIGDRRDIYR